MPRDTKSKPDQKPEERQVEQAVDPKDAMSLALDAVNATDLGVSIIDELGTLFRTIEAAASGPDDLSEAQMRARLSTIRRMALLAAQFTDEREDTFSFYRDDAHDMLAALTAGAV
jgi:hypothetical protein